MFFANNIKGERTYIDDAEIKQTYVCPVCKSIMTQKRGNINAHHFAHKTGKECDAWYSGKLSPWHIKMQSYFKKGSQELAIWNKSHTEFHIADAVVQIGDVKYVIEFQHSVISQKEFLSSSCFYIKSGYRLVWVFDFCECIRPKRIYIAEDGYENGIIRLTWPGKDRIKFLDNIDFSNTSDYLHIFFHISTGKGKKQLHTPNGYCPWETWEYIDPFHRSPCFIELALDYFTGAADFYAKYYSEDKFYKIMKRYGQNDLQISK